MRSISCQKRPGGILKAPRATHWRCHAPVTTAVNRISAVGAAGGAGGDADGAARGSSSSSGGGGGGGSGGAEGPPTPGLMDRIKSFMQSGKVDKQKLAEYGLGAFAAYGELRGWVGAI
jgi:hypothetical protein